MKHPKGTLRDGVGTPADIPEGIHEVIPSGHFVIGGSKARLVEDPNCDTHPELEVYRRIRDVLKVR